MSIQEEVHLKVKHMAGKHPQKTHAGSRGSGGSNGVQPSMDSLARGALPKRSPKGKSVDSLKSQLEAAVGEVSTEGTKMGLRDARRAVGIASDMDGAKYQLDKLIADAESSKNEINFPKGYFDGLDMAYGILEINK